LGTFGDVVIFNDIGTEIKFYVKKRVVIKTSNTHTNSALLTLSAIYGLPMIGTGRILAKKLRRFFGDIGLAT
jgi:CRISPR/Cas system CMR subunit Cmr6 (Cas7 group RAMP superfamily)